MKPTVKNRVSRLIVGILTLPRRAAAKLDEETKRNCCSADKSARLLPESAIINFTGDHDRIQIGSHSISRGECRVFGASGHIQIGSYCYIGDGTKIWSSVGVTIGDRVLIAHSVNIHDNDSHPLSAAQRHNQTVGICYQGKYDLDGVGMAPVVIEDDAWIGFNVAILKGVRVGKGAIIGASTVITKDVPPYAVMAGNPPRLVGTASA